MISEVNMLSWLGASPGEPVIQESGLALADAAAFSALIDEATACVPAPVVPPAPVVTEVFHSTFLVEWCLGGPELALGAPGPSEGDAHADAEADDVPAAPARRAGGEHESNGVPPLGVEWLPMPEIQRPQGVSVGSAVTSTPEAASQGNPEAASLPKSVTSTQPDARGLNLPIDLEGPAPVERTGAVVDDAAQPVRMRGEGPVQPPERVQVMERMPEVLERASIEHGAAAQGKASAEDGASGSSPRQQEYGARPEMGGRTPAYPSSIGFDTHIAMATELRGTSARFAPQAAGTEISQREMPEPESLQQLVQTMRVQFRQGIGDAVVRLKPEHLGEVSIHLRVEQQNVSAVVRAEVPAVRQWLELNETALRQNLSQHGLHLDKFVVREDDSRREQPEPRDEPQGRRRERRQPHTPQNEPAPQFELLV